MATQSIECWTMASSIRRADQLPDPRPMTVQDLVTRFPEIPADLHREPLLAQFADTFGDLLAVAVDPSACAAEYDETNHYYLGLIGPLKIYMYGLSSKEKALEHLRDMLQRRSADYDGFAASLLAERPAR